MHLRDDVALAGKHATRPNTAQNVDVKGVVAPRDRHRAANGRTGSTVVAPTVLHCRHHAHRPLELALRNDYSSDIHLSNVIMGHPEQLFLTTGSKAAGPGLRDGVG